jgi:hypothetical protein
MCGRLSKSILWFAFCSLLTLCFGVDTATSVCASSSEHVWLHLAGDGGSKVATVKPLAQHGALQGQSMHCYSARLEARCCLQHGA